MYVDQFAENDLARDLCARHGVPLHRTVDAALCDGGDALAVDAVLLIGEHGDYPSNAIGQKLYPRKELFDRIVKRFRSDGRAVPIFCDKHLAWDFDSAREMAAVRACSAPSPSMMVKASSPSSSAPPGIASRARRSHPVFSLK